MAAAIATAFSASPTMAASYSSASLSNFKVSLVDLDLEDGVTPSVSFTHNWWSGAFGSIYKSSRGEAGIFILDAPASKTITNTANTASASFSGDNFDNKVLQASGNSLGGGLIIRDKSRVKRYDSAGYLSSLNDRVPFTLSPNTQLNITADALNYVETTIGADAHERAYSVAKLAISRDRFYGAFYDFDTVEFAAPIFGEGSALKLSELTLLSAMLNNIDEQEFTGFIESNLFNAGASFAEVPRPTVVPVPAALPLMASALGLFGLGAKRRKALKV